VPSQGSGWSLSVSGWWCDFIFRLVEGRERAVWLVSVRLHGQPVPSENRPLGHSLFGRPPHFGPGVRLSACKQNLYVPRVSTNPHPGYRHYVVVLSVLLLSTVTERKPHGLLFRLSPLAQRLDPKFVISVVAFGVESLAECAPCAFP
jgi:hypothetical protein